MGLFDFFIKKHKDDAITPTYAAGTQKSEKRQNTQNVQNQVKKEITNEIVNRLMDEAVELGYVDSTSVHEHVKKNLKNYEYNFNEVFVMEMAYEKAHPGIYVERFYEMKMPSPGDPYATDGIVFEYHFPTHQVYYHGYHYVPGGFGWGGTGSVNLTDWDYIYDEAQKNKEAGKLDKEVWTKVQKDMDDYPNKPQSYLSFLELVKG